MSQQENLHSSEENSQHSQNGILENPFDSVPEIENSDVKNIAEPLEDASSEKETKIILTPAVEAFAKEIEALATPEERLERSILFLEQILTQNSPPHFKDFWQARDISIRLFKEQISPTVRAALWIKYSELSKEARRLKEQFDEQSAFASEQIDIAVKALEADLIKFEKPKDPSEASSEASLEQYSFKSEALAKNLPFYKNNQHQLDLLNTYASRINSLRKELIRTEMRVRKKNQFFQRLSHAGDQVFPKRKQLIQDISSQFNDDVEAFINANFNRPVPSAPCFVLREEIKLLQNTAKLLTLSSPVFAQTRMRLSECWDKIKEFDKERKKERAQQKNAFQQNKDELLQKLDAIASEKGSGQLNSADAIQRLNAISKQMRDVELGRDEVKILKDRLEEIRVPILDEIKNEEKTRQDHEQERVRQKQQRLIDLKHEVQAFIQDVGKWDLEKLLADRDALLEKIASAPMPNHEKAELERSLKSLRDVIAEKKEQALLSLPEGDRHALGQLKQLLQQRKERRQEIKDQIESLRRASGVSGLDFGRAMEYNAQLKEEKERLEKINSGIEEIREKIAQLTGK